MKIPSFWKNSTILSEIQVNYVQGIIIAGETIKLGMPRKELKRLYHIYEIQIIMFKKRITMISWFGSSGCQTWIGIKGWLNIRRQLRNNHIFVCHNSIIGTLWLGRCGRICDGKTHLVIFLLVLIITFSWIWTKLFSFVIRAN